MPRQLSRLLGLVLLVAPAILFAVAVADDAAVAADPSDQYSIGVQLPDGDTIRINFPPDADAMEVATEVGQSHGLSEQDVRQLAANLLATRPRLTVQYPGAATPFSYFKGRDPEISALRYAQAQKIPLVEGTQRIAALVRQNLEPAELEGLSPPKDLKFMLPVSSVISGTQDDRSVPFWSTSVPKAFASNLCGQLVPENLGDACYERVIQLIQENLDVQPASEEPVPVAVHILTVDGQNIQFPFFEGDTTATVASRFTAANSLPDSVTSQIDAALQAAVAKAAAAETSPDSSAESAAAAGAVSSLTVQARVNVKLSEGLVQMVRVAAGEDMKSAADFAAAMMKQPPQLAEQLAAALANDAAATGPSSHDVVETVQLDIGDTRVSLPIHEGDSAFNVARRFGLGQQLSSDVANQIKDAIAPTIARIASAQASAQEPDSEALSQLVAALPLSVGGQVYPIHLHNGEQPGAVALFVARMLGVEEGQAETIANGLVSSAEQSAPQPLRPRLTVSLQLFGQNHDIVVFETDSPFTVARRYGMKIGLTGEQARQLAEDVGAAMDSHEATSQGAVDESSPISDQGSDQAADGTDGTGAPAEAAATVESSDNTAEQGAQHSELLEQLHTFVAAAQAYVAEQLEKWDVFWPTLVADVKDATAGAMSLPEDSRVGLALSGGSAAAVLLIARAAMCSRGETPPTTAATAPAKKTVAKESTSNEPATKKAGTAAKTKRRRSKSKPRSSSS